MCFSLCPFEIDWMWTRVEIKKKRRICTNLPEEIEGSSLFVESTPNTCFDKQWKKNEPFRQNEFVSQDQLKKNLLFKQTQMNEKSIKDNNPLPNNTALLGHRTLENMFRWPACMIELLNCNMDREMTYRAVVVVEEEWNKNAFPSSINWRAIESEKVKKNLLLKLVVV